MQLFGVSLLLFVGFGQGLVLSRVLERFDEATSTDVSFDIREKSEEDYCNGEDLDESDFEEGNFDES